jgi:hypothetical protein
MGAICSTFPLLYLWTPTDTRNMYVLESAEIVAGLHLNILRLSHEDAMKI